MPFPRDYVLGIDRQKLDFESRFSSYLHGQWKQGGWWYYYLYAMAVKTPLGALGLLGLAASLLLTRAGRARWRAELFLLAPAVAVLALVSSETGFSHHLRYVLPAYPYLFIFSSKPFADWLGRRRPRLLLAGALGAWAVASSLAVYPHSMSYFNELVGGPRDGHYHLDGSNSDWGQDLIYLREWLNDHPESAPRGIALFMGLPPALAGVTAATPPPPKEPEPGWYVLAICRAHDASNDYRYFLRFQPAAMIGYSTYVYHITLDEANRVRRELGLPPLPAAQARESKP